MRIPNVTRPIVPSGCFAALACLLLPLIIAPAFADEPPAKPKTTFRTATVERGSITATVRTRGTVEPEDVVDIGAQVAGTVKSFGPDPRDKTKTIDFCSEVEAGTVLAQIDSTTYENAVDQAKANLARAEAELKLAVLKSQQAEVDWKRVQELGKTKVISAQDVEVCKNAFELARASVGVNEAAVKQAQAALQAAEINLSYCTIKSPVKGVVIDRRINVGQTVVASLSAPSLFLIAKDLKKMQVWASVSEADVGRIRVGQAARFSVDAFPKDSFQGKVSQVRLNASMTQNVVTYTVVVATNNPADTDSPFGKLLPYMTADIEFVVERREKVLLVPNAALRWRPQADQVAADARDEFLKLQRPDKEADAKDGAARGLVWVEDKGFVRPVKVRIGISDGRRTEVAGELAEGSSVVIGLTAPKVPASPFDKERGQKPADDARAAIANTGASTLVIHPGQASSGGANFGTGTVVTLTPQDAEAIADKDRCPAVKAASPIVRIRTNVVYGDRQWIPMNIYGVTPAYLDVRECEVEEGTPFDDRLRQPCPQCRTGLAAADHTVRS